MSANLNTLQHVIADQNPYGGADFKNESTKLWRDNLKFNIFDSKGYYTDEAKQFFKDNDIKMKAGETPADAILRFAEWFEMGYQCDKVTVKRSDVKFSGSMIMNAYITAQETGRQFYHNQKNEELDGIDLDEMRSEDAYMSKAKATKSKDLVERNETIAEMNKRHNQILSNL